MTEYVQHKRMESPDGSRAITLEHGEHGLCRFVIWKLYDPSPENPEIGGLTWLPDEFSGIYASLSEAEEAAKAQLSWLKV